MNYILDVIACGLVVFTELAAVIMGVILVQLLVYRLTGISLYNKILNLFFREVI